MLMNCIDCGAEGQKLHRFRLNPDCGICKACVWAALRQTFGEMLNNVSPLRRWAEMTPVPSIFDSAGNVKVRE